MSTPLTLFYADSDEQVEDAVDLEIRDPASYLGARRALAGLLQRTGHAPVRVAVYGSRLHRWTVDLARLPGAEVRRVGLRAQLEKQWQRALPADLTPKEIEAMDVGDLAIPQGVSLEDALVAHALDAVWLESPPSKAHFARLLLSPPPATTTPWLRRQRHARLEAWAEAAGSLAPAYHAYAHDPAGLKDAALREAARRALPREVGAALPSAHGKEAVLRAAEALRGSALRDEALQEGRRLLAPALHAHWAQRFRDDEGPLSDLVDALPDRMPEALGALADLLESGGLSMRRLSPATLEQLRRSQTGPGSDAGLIERLLPFVLPEPPAPPDPDWRSATSLDPWRAWLEAYLAYRAALERLGADEQEFEAIGRQAEAFSDWFTEQYALLLHEGGDLVTSVHRTVRARLEEGARVLWVIWDNLPGHHADPLVRGLTAAGFELAEDPEWRLALLPSVTKVSFPALLAGRLTSPGEGTTTHAHRTALLEETFTGHSVQFKNDLLGLKQLAVAPADLSVVHFTNYDALLHKREHELEDRREVELAGMRTRTIARLSETLTAFPHDRPAYLIITSDHGSTRLPHGVAQKVPLPEGAEEVEQFSSRAVQIRAGTPSSPDVCTRLEPEDTKLGSPVLLARGLRSWSSPSANAGYVHGGAPSEEGRPKEFPEAVAWLALRMGVDVGHGYRPPRRKDGGVDVVAWRPFPDGRTGFPVLLVQCTLEANVVHKSRDVDARLWAGWLSLDVDPSAALAFPGLLPRAEDWREVASRCVVLDRLRLSHLLAGATAPAAAAAGEWSRATLEALREDA